MFIVFVNVQLKFSQVIYFFIIKLNEKIRGHEQLRLQKLGFLMWNSARDRMCLWLYYTYAHGEQMDVTLEMK